MTALPVDEPLATAPGAVGPLTPRRLAAITAGLVLGVSLAALDMTIVATAVRTIADDLGGVELQAWATTAYLVTAAISTPLYGRLSDVYGRKPLFLVAISVFVAGSLACSIARSMPELAAYRAIQGLGAGGLFSLAVTIIGDVVPARERARHGGRLIAVYALFGVLGPVAGGFPAATPDLFGITGWRWVFLVNVPVGALATVIVAVFLRLPRVRGDRRVDWLGAAALSLGVVPLLVVAEEGRSWGWTAPASLACYVLGVVGLALFVAVEARAGVDALLPLRFFRFPAFRLCSLAGLIIGFGMFGAITALPLYLQIVKGRSPTAAGLLMVPMVAGIVVGSALSGRAIARLGRYRIWPLSGSALMVLGMFWLSAIGAATAMWPVAAAMIAFGVGLGANLQPLTSGVQNAVPRADSGVATASAAFVRQLGGSLGAAVFLSVLFGALPQRIAGALRTAATTPGFRAALTDPAVLAEPANRVVAESLRVGGGAADAVLTDSSVLSRLHPELARPFLTGFAEATSLVFAVGAVVLVVGLVAALLLPDEQLLAGDD